ncbi:MAG: hypothetical protein LBE56_00150 [Tannerella sp.]|jgi:antitoxin MazE|nr:hypothetical protein [Tannerella sp.]
METMIKIRKWGNGLGINIPATIVNGLSLKEGHYVYIKEYGNRIIIEPPSTQVSYSLTDMLDAITEDNTHHCIETGMATGNEIW